jgi:hypothetical protein
VRPILHLTAVITQLTQRAAALLVRAGHAASDATLRWLAGDPAGRFHRG